VPFVSCFATLQFRLISLGSLTIESMSPDAYFFFSRSDKFYKDANLIFRCTCDSLEYVLEKNGQLYVDWQLASSMCLCPKLVKCNIYTVSHVTLLIFDFFFFKKIIDLLHGVRRQTVASFLLVL